MNPLHQNYKHVKVVQSLLNLDERNIHSVVVFTGDCIFKTNMPPEVTKGGGYISYIKSKREVVFTKQQVRDMTIKIKQVRLAPTYKTSQLHVTNVRRNKASKVTPIRKSK